MLEVELVMFGNVDQLINWQFQQSLFRVNQCLSELLDHHVFAGLNKNRALELNGI